MCIRDSCIPVLLYDRQRRIVAAVHAGWRGTVNRILAKTLHRMQSAYGTRGTDVIACIGPGISLDSFEAVSYTHLTLPTNREVEMSVVAAY